MLFFEISNVEASAIATFLRIVSSRTCVNIKDRDLRSELCFTQCFTVVEDILKKFSLFRH